MRKFYRGAVIPARCILPQSEDQISSFFFRSGLHSYASVCPGNFCLTTSKPFLVRSRNSLSVLVNLMQAASPSNKRGAFWSSVA